MKTRMQTTALLLIALIALTTDVAMPPRPIINTTTTEAQA